LQFDLITRASTIDIVKEDGGVSNQINKARSRSFNGILLDAVFIIREQGFQTITRLKRNQKDEKLKIAPPPIGTISR